MPKRELGDPFKSPKAQKRKAAPRPDDKLPLWERVPVEKPKTGFQQWEAEKRRAQSTDENNRG